MVLSRDELFSELKEVIGDEPTDESVKLLEDLTDTLNDMESKLNGDGENWKERYNALDLEWKKKYTERFFSGEPEEKEDIDESEEQEEPENYEDLFEESEE